MNKYLYLTLILGVLIHTTGCRHQHLSRATSPHATPTTDSTLVNRPSANKPTETVKPAIPVQSGADVAATGVAEIDFRYLTAKSKISFKSPNQEVDNASVSIRIHQDSLIWLSVSKLGIEAARTLITRDSIKILDKIHHDYSVYDFPTLSKQFNFALNFSLLQALIVGNLPLPGQPAQERKDDPTYRILVQQEGQVIVENYIDATSRKLKKLVMTQQPAKNTLRLDYDDFGSLNNFLFPFTSLLTLDYQSQADGQSHQTVLRSKYSKVDLVDQSPGFPFTIPASYQRRP